MSTDHIKEIIDIELCISDEFKSEKWDAIQFLDSILNIDKSCFVITDNINNHQLVMGYIVSYNHKDFINIENIAVQKDFRRMGYGYNLLKLVECKSLSKPIFCEVSEHFTNMHLLLRKSGYMGGSFHVDNGEYYYIFTKERLIM